MQTHEDVTTWCARVEHAACTPLRFVLDVSGSMYRFNSEDRRLERCCQMAVLLMEYAPHPPPTIPVDGGREADWTVEVQDCH